MDNFLKQQMKVYLDCRDKIAELNGSVPAVRCRDRMMSEIAEMERKAEKITNRSRKLYGDFADGMISEEDYLFAKKTYQDELESIRDQIDKNEEVHSILTKTMAVILRWLKHMEGILISGFYLQKLFVILLAGFHFMGRIALR